jgi:uncharacterized protein YbjT (DUF2867 family)
MTTAEGRMIVVTGATGLQGSAVTRQLLKANWKVRALTRNPGSKPAQALKALGAEVVQGDMADAESLRASFTGAYGVYNVQNPYISGLEGEVRQGKNVADVAKEMQIAHLVYGSAGIGRRGTTIPSWDTKLEIEDAMKALGLPLTILRPMAFMELMTHKKFFPSAAIWHIMPTLMGASRPVGWLCTDDLGTIVANMFEFPQEYIGKELSLASDVQSLEQCRSIYREVMGKNPARFPMPIRLFERFGLVGKDLTTMWRWLRTATFDLNTAMTRTILPGARTVRQWLQEQKEG